VIKHLDLSNSKIKRDAGAFNIVCDACGDAKGDR